MSLSPDAWYADGQHFDFNGHTLPYRDSGGGDAAVLLVDARKGALKQTRRPTFIARIRTGIRTGFRPHPLLKPQGPAYICPVPLGTMGINALVISGSDPGAVPGGSTKHPSLGGHGAETGSTNV